MPANVELIESDIHTESMAETGLLRSAINKAMGAVLTHREKTILDMRFGLNGYEPHTLKEVAQEFATGLERIRQIEAKALSKIRNSEKKYARELKVIGKAQFGK